MYCRNLDAGPSMKIGERSSRKELCTEDRPTGLDIIFSIHVGGSVCVLFRLAILRSSAKGDYPPNSIKEKLPMLIRHQLLSAADNRIEESVEFCMASRSFSLRPCG